MPTSAATGGQCARSGSNPKPEGRNKFEPPSALGFGLRISELGLLSAFGLRVSGLEWPGPTLEPPCVWRPRFVTPRPIVLPLRWGEWAGVRGNGAYAVATEPRRSRKPMEDRQNHGRTESWGTKTESGLTVHHRRRRMNLLFMILSHHDSVLRGGARIPRRWRTTSAAGGRERMKPRRAIPPPAGCQPAKQRTASPRYRPNADALRRSADC